MTFHRQKGQIQVGITNKLELTQSPQSKRFNCQHSLADNISGHTNHIQRDHWLALNHY